MFIFFVIACLVCRSTAAPAFAGGLPNPVVPPKAAKALNPESAQGSPTDPDCPLTDGTIPLYIPDPASCSKYTVCSGIFGQKQECGPGMHFSVATSSCTFPALANCPLLDSKMADTESPADLKGPSGIDSTAYPIVGLTGLPEFDNPAEGIGQLPGSATVPVTDYPGITQNEG